MFVIVFVVICLIDIFGINFTFAAYDMCHFLVNMFALLTQEAFLHQGYFKDSWLA